MFLVEEPANAASSYSKASRMLSARVNDRSWQPALGIKFADTMERKPRDYTWDSSHGLRFASRGSKSMPASLEGTFSRSLSIQATPGLQESTCIQSPEHEYPDMTALSFSHNSPHDQESPVNDAWSLSELRDALPAGRDESADSHESSERTSTAKALANRDKHTIVNDGLNYRMKLDLMRKAIAANETLEDLEGVVPDTSTDKSSALSQAPFYWDYALYTNESGHKPTMHYCRNLEESEREAQELLSEKVLGFDMEWVVPLYGRATSSIKKNVSIIQVASESRIALFHIALHHGDSAEELLAPSLRKIVESPDIVKVGVAIAGDCTRLNRNFGVESKGILELSNLHKVVKYAADDPSMINLQLVRLAQQVREHLLLPLDKGPDVRQSDWAKELSMEQMNYAANDAYAGLRLYHLMNAKRKAMKPIPGMPMLVDRRRLLIAQPLKSPTRSRSNSPLARNSTPADEFIEADAWAVNYIERLATLSPPRTPVLSGRRHLRAYALWHHQNLPISDIAKLCQISRFTAAGYVLDAVMTEGHIPSSLDDEQADEDRLSWDRDRCQDALEILGYSEEKGDERVRIPAHRRYLKLWKALT